MELSKAFKTSTEPGTNRKVIQLTYGEGLHYPLYYFIPSITQDNRYLIYHKAYQGTVQLYRLDLQTAEVVQLTDAKGQNTWWYPWCTDKGIGVLDHRSVLNVVSNQVIYFEESDAYVVDVVSLEKRHLFSLPEGRMAIGQNCVTPDGQWFVYIHHDKETFKEKIMKASYFEGRCMSKNTALCAYNLTTGEHRNLLFIHSPIHHVLPYDENRVVFCHPATENGMLLTTLEGGHYTHLRTQDENSGCVCHYLATKKGLMYEVLGSSTGKVYAGLYNPDTHKKYELPLPDYFGYTHTGADEEGRMWFYENYKKQSESEYVHNLYYLKEHDPLSGDTWIKLIDNWATYGGGQSSHFHPRLTPDRKWILFTGGDTDGKSNQMYLLDVSDLEDTRGIPDIL